MPWQPPLPTIPVLGQDSLPTASCISLNFERVIHFDCPHPSKLLTLHLTAYCFCSQTIIFFHIPLASIHDELKPSSIDTILSYLAHKINTILQIHVRKFSSPEGTNKPTTLYFVCMCVCACPVTTHKEQSFLINKLISKQ